MKRSLAFVEAALVLGGCTAPDVTSSPSSAPASAECQADVRDSRNQRLQLTTPLGNLVCATVAKTNAFFERTGRSEAAKVVVVYLEGDRVRYTCGDQIFYNAPNTIGYCRRTDAIVLSEHGLTNLAQGNSLEAAANLAVGHEKGHGLQRLYGFPGSGAMRRTELHADCAAGMVTGAESPELAGQITNMLGGLGNYGHGTGKERQAAFGYGVQHGNCDPAALERAGIIPPPLY